MNNTVTIPKPKKVTTPKVVMILDTRFSGGSGGGGIGVMVVGSTFIIG